MKLNTKFYTYLLILISQIALGQNPLWENPNFRTKKVAFSDTIQLDSLVILKEKFSVKDLNNNIIKQDNYTLQSEKGRLIMKKKTQDSLIISYFINPLFESKTTYPINPKIIVNPTYTSILEDAYTVNSSSNLWDGIDSEGSMIRGLSFGNNQGSSVASTLDLRLSGKLSKELNILAYISDTNIPIETGGYTQNIEQFDRVFVEIFNDKSKIRAGHISLNNEKEMFGRFSRKFTGLQLSHAFGEENSLKTTLSGSVSRGEFNQMIFNGIEGNQGPYKLAGKNNEAYVIVLSNSEKIYLDGRLLKRGENLDYIMDYNTGEISFTNNILITSQSRITAEYQYANRNYSRLNLFGGFDYEKDKLKISTHVYSQSDDKNNTIQQNLTKEEMEILSQAGNNKDLMHVSTAKKVPFDKDKVLYKKIKTSNAEYFEHSKNPKDELYEVYFSQVGSNKGNYQISKQGENQRVFKYVEPVNGIHQGSFEPVKQLIAPEKHQLISSRFAYNFSENGKIELQTGISNYDSNLFSEIDNNKNIGLALQLNAKQQYRLNKLLITPYLSYSYIQNNFASLERLRSPEFARDFNLETEFGQFTQHYIQSKLDLLVSPDKFISYNFDLLNNQGDYKGFKHELKGLYSLKKYSLDVFLRQLNSESSIEKTNFSKYDISLKKEFKKINFSVGAKGENNQRKNLFGKFNPLSFRNSSIYASAMLGDSANLYSELRLYNEKIDSIRGNSFKNQQTAYGFIWKNRLIKNQNQELAVNTNFRKLTDESKQKQNFLNATINWQISLLKKTVNLRVNYGISGGSEFERVFTYVKVADGMGIYKWTDYNQDGEEQLDEFEVAQFSDEANYIRVYTNTLSQIYTNKNILNANLSWLPGNYNKQKNFWDRIQHKSYLAHQANFLKGKQAIVWNPFENENLRSKSQQYTAITYYNLGRDYLWHAQHSFNYQSQMNYVFIGLESRINRTHTSEISYTPRSVLEFSLQHKHLDNSKKSERFANNNFSYFINEMSPKLKLKSKKSILDFSYHFKKAKAEDNKGELKSHSLNATWNWNQSEKTQMHVNLEWVNNKFDGNSNSVIGNEMMEGLKTGQNWIWRISLQRNLTKSLQMNLHYTGRKNTLHNSIHTGNVQVKLNF